MFFGTAGSIPSFPALILFDMEQIRKCSKFFEIFNNGPSTIDLQQSVNNARHPPALPPGTLPTPPSCWTYSPQSLLPLCLPIPGSLLPEQSRFRLLALLTVQQKSSMTILSSRWALLWGWGCCFFLWVCSPMWLGWNLGKSILKPFLNESIESIEIQGNKSNHQNRRCWDWFLSILLIGWCSGETIVELRNPDIAWLGYIVIWVKEMIQGCWGV